jgi:hypothetical protein
VCVLVAVLLNACVVHGSKVYTIVFQSHLLNETPVQFRGSFAPDDIAVVQQAY